jgi:hypothetical protein
METLDVKEAAALRKAWGDKPCEHPWWVEETVGGAAMGRVACKTCGLDRRKGAPLPDSGKGKTKTDSATATIPDQQGEELDLTASIQKVTDLNWKAPASNQQVQDLDSAADGIVDMLTEDFALTLQDEAKIAAVMDKLRDALGQWRERQRNKKR